MAERALEMMCTRAASREAFGKMLLRHVRRGGEGRGGEGRGGEGRGGEGRGGEGRGGEGREGGRDGRVGG